MALVEDHEVVETFAPDRTDHALDVCGFGAKAITPPEDQPFGRRCRLADPFGHLWMMATPKSVVNRTPPRSK